MLLTSVGALCGAIITVYFLAQQGWIDLSGQTQGIMSIVVIGAATDYGLLYTARFREALHHTTSRWTATRMAWKGTVPAVLASGTTVIAGLLCLLFSALTSNRGVGPATAMGVVFAILAGLTLLPALLALFGRVALWPQMPRVDENPETHEQAMNPYDHKGLWPSVARLVDRRSRAVWLVCAVVLGAAAVGASQLDADGVPQSEFVLGESEARDGLAVIERHFPGGAGDPVYVLTPQEDAQAVAEQLSQDDDVASVAFTAQDSPNGTLPYPTPQGGPLANAGPTVSNGDVLIQATLTYASDSEEAQATVTRLRDDLAGITPDAKIGGTTAVQDPVYVLAPQEDAQAVAERLSQDDDVASVAFTAQDSPNGTLPYPTPQGGPLANAGPTVSNGDVLIQATLTYASDSEEAQATVTRLRDDLAGITPDAKIGGTTAVQVDTIAASERDRALIIPILLAVILLILMVLLRSILMPVLLIATTVLSFFSALGVATLVFHLMDINQADPTVPLFSFVFLVALGIDYNIFLMSRVREEVVTAGHRKGVLAGLITTGGVITSAGIVLAATFAALAVLPILFLVQLAIIVTTGVLMDTIIVRSLLVPALALDIGPRSWWPSRVGTPGKHRAPPTTPR